MMAEYPKYLTSGSQVELRATKAGAVTLFRMAASPKWCRRDAGQLESTAELPTHTICGAYRNCRSLLSQAVIDR